MYKVQNQACNWKKILKLTAKLENAYFSGIAQIELAYIVSDTVSNLFEVKDPHRPVFSTILCRFYSSFL